MDNHRRPDSDLKRLFEAYDDEALSALIDELDDLADEAKRERIVRAHWRSHGEVAA